MHLPFISMALAFGNSTKQAQANASLCVCVCVRNVQILHNFTRGIKDPWVLLITKVQLYY